MANKTCIQICDDRHFFMMKSFQFLWTLMSDIFFYFSCNDDFFGIFPTSIFIASMGIILFKEYQRRNLNWPDGIFHKFMILGVFVLSTRMWIFSTKVTRCILNQTMQIAKDTCNNDKIEMLLIFFQNQEEYLHLTICWAFSLMPANYASDTYIYKLFLIHIYPLIPSFLRDVDLLTSIATVSIILNFIELIVKCITGNCIPALQALIDLYTK